MATVTDTGDGGSSAEPPPGEPPFAEVPNPRYGSFISSRPLPLRVPKRTRWYGFFWRLLYGWRYGYSHPDEDLLGVVDAVGDALSVQAAAAHAVLTGERREEAGRIQRRLQIELSSELPDFSTLLGLEARLNALYPPGLAQRRRWMILERFRRVAAPSARLFWADNPPEADAVADGGDASRMIGAAEAALRAALARKEQASAGLQLADQEKTAADMALAAAPDGDKPALRTAAESAAAKLTQAREELAGAQRGIEEAQRHQERVQAQVAVNRARAELEEKGRQGDEARRTLERTLPGSAERLAAQERLEAVLAERATAQDALDEKVRAAAALGGGGTGGSGSGGGGGTGGFPGEAAGTSGTGDGGEEVSEDQADAHALLGYIHNSYLMTTAREKAIRDLKRWMLVRFWAFILAILLGLVVVYAGLSRFDLGHYWGLVLGLAIIAAVGRAGATTSIIRRMQDAISDNVLATDPVIELTALRTGKNEISLALISSSIFALLLYAFFATGVPDRLGFTGGIFPAMAQGTQAQAERAQEDAVAAAAADNQEEEAKPPGAAEAPQTAAPATSAGGPPPGKSDEPPVQSAATAAPAPAAAPAAVPGGTTRGPADGLASLRARYFAARTAAAEGAAAVIGNQGDASRSQEATIQAIDQQQQALAAAMAFADAAEEAGNADAARQAERYAVRERGQLRRLAQLREAPRTPPSLACEPGKTCDPVPALAAALGLAGPADFFKLLIWAFIAGFAERFVPDMLDRVVSRNKELAEGRSREPRPAQPPAPAAPAVPAPPPAGAANPQLPDTG